MSDGVEIKFNFKFQAKILALAIKDETFLSKYADHLQPNYFGEIHHQILYGKIHDYYEKYHKTPTLEAIFEEVEAISDLDKRALVAEAFSDALEDELDDREFYENKLFDFCKNKSALLGLSKAATLLNEGDVEGILPTLEKSLLLVDPNAQESVGSKYWQDLGKVNLDDNLPKIPTLLGAPSGYGLDKVLKGGLKQKNVALVMMPTGTGKSVFLMNVAANAIYQGYNVVYITLELTEMDIIQRLNMFFSGMAQESLEDMNTAEIREGISKSYPGVKFGELIIKEFPMKSISVRGLEAYVKTISRKEGWKPDLVCIDYMDIIKAPIASKEQWQQLQDISEELKSFAQRYKVPIWTAGQVNRGGEDKNLIKNRDSSGSYNKIFGLDVVLTANPKMDKETHQKTASLFVSKNRQGVDQVTLNYKCDFEHMRFEYVNSEYSVEEKKLSEFEKFKRARKNG